MKFTKMHGIGNDYIYVNCFEEVVSDPERLAIVMSKPHFGCGSDGLILIEPSDTADSVDFSIGVPIPSLGIKVQF